GGLMTHNLRDFAAHVKLADTITIVLFANLITRWRRSDRIRNLRICQVWNNPGNRAAESNKESALTHETHGPMLSDGAHSTIERRAKSSRRHQSSMRVNACAI